MAPLHRPVVRQVGPVLPLHGRGRLAVEGALEGVDDPDGVPRADHPVETRGAPQAPAVVEAGDGGGGVLLVEDRAVAPGIDVEGRPSAQLRRHAEAGGSRLRRHDGQEDALRGEHRGGVAVAVRVADVRPPGRVEGRAIRAVQAEHDVVTALVLLLEVPDPVPRSREAQLALRAPEHVGEVPPRDDRRAAWTVGHEEGDVAVPPRTQPEAILPGLRSHDPGGVHRVNLACGGLPGGRVSRDRGVGREHRHGPRLGERGVREGTERDQGQGRRTPAPRRAPRHDRSEAHRGPILAPDPLSFRAGPTREARGDRLAGSRRRGLRLVLR